MKSNLLSYLLILAALATVMLMAFIGFCLVTGKMDIILDAFPFLAG